MKKVLFAFFLLSAPFINAQNWTCINPLAITHFAGSDSVIHSIRIDSSNIHGDTVDYFNYYMLRQNDWDCFKLKGGSWTGTKISVLSNGFTIFYTYKQMPVSIKTNALLNESWHLYDFADSRYIEAKIAAHNTMTFLGITDSVKIISLQMKDHLGNPINAISTGDSIDIINNASLRLSKNYGLIKIIDFYRFPYFTQNIETFYSLLNVYDIIGISNPVVGYQNFTAKDVYDFNPGDEIHSFYLSSYCAPPVTGYEIKIIEKYLSKSISLNQDTITYLVKRCMRRKDFQYSDSTITYTNDTVISKIILSQCSFLSRLSNEPFPKSTISYSFNTTIGNSKYISDYMEFFTNGTDSCLHQIIADYVGTKQYMKGLGAFFDNYGSGLEPTNRRVLVYYKKGTLEWGTPYNCSELLSVPENAALENRITISPNPFSTTTQITLSQTYHTISLSVYDMQGKLISQDQHTDCDKIQLNRNSLTNGMYFLKLIMDDKEITTGKIVVSD